MDVSAVDGFKCVLLHRCVQSKEAMRTHYKRHHANQVVEFQPVRVQAVRTFSRNSQLSESRSRSE
ncbi:hypothetical protein V1525DRAFT_411218 [Lipomyces kononenkoae]|uniref:Uncharacterized protein n=1 Tax=Lipomyces kononenkoae TaxID=34357 RepID=A0ACC3STN8_LIPKO